MLELVFYYGDIEKEWETLFLDFPSGEIFPFDVIKKAYENQTYQIIHLYRNEMKIGYAHIIVVDRTVILSFLSINKELRGQNLGHIFIGMLKQQFKEYNAMLVEVEPETLKIYKNGISRMRFYESLGFDRLCDVTYQIREQGTKEYSEICLYMLHMNSNMKHRVPSYEEIKDILDLYYGVLFEDRVEEEYKLILNSEAQ